MSKKVRHVVPSVKGGWVVKDSGSSVSSEIYATKEQAINKGVTISRVDGSQLFIHRKDGSIGDVRSYAADTLPPRIEKNAK
ncbi:MAG: DUF2188 domain-containing protein [Anaerofustis sp.]